MTETFKPSDQQGLTELIAWAAAEEVPLELLGSGSKRKIGRPVEAEHVVDLSALSGIHFYEPEELVLSVGAGTPMELVQQLLAQQNQMFAFEPPDMGWLLSGESAQESSSGTVGGMVASGLSGPRRFKAGGVRDHVLGATAVSGRGEVFVSGGRVVKNVTGYDLPKLLTGSWGTLAVIADLNLKVLPLPEKAYTLVLFGLDETQAVDAMTRAAQSPYEVSGLAYVPADLTQHSHVSYVSTSGASVTAIRVEGPEISVKHRMESLRNLVAGMANMDELHSANSAAFWSEIRDVRLMPQAHEIVWRLSVAPTEARAVVAACTPDSHFLDAAGGLIWLGYSVADGAHVTKVRGAVTSGHATLIKAPEALRRTEAVFQPQPGPLAALSARVENGFDPHGVLNPGRMVKGV